MYGVVTEVCSGPQKIGIKVVLSKSLVIDDIALVDKLAEQFQCWYTKQRSYD